MTGDYLCPTTAGGIERLLGAHCPAYDINSACSGFVFALEMCIRDRGATWEARPIEFAPVGEGNLDWKPIIEFCKNKGVKSYAIEQDCCYGRDEFDCVKSSFDYLKKMGVDD